MTFTFRGCGRERGRLLARAAGSTTCGAAIDHLARRAEPDGVWLAGTARAARSRVCVAAVDDPECAASPLLGARADFDDWAGQPRRFLEHAREIGAIRNPVFPPSFDAWARELRAVPAARRAPGGSRPGRC